MKSGRYPRPLSLSGSGNARAGPEVAVVNEFPVKMTCVIYGCEGLTPHSHVGVFMPLTSPPPPIIPIYPMPQYVYHGQAKGHHIFSLIFLRHPLCLLLHWIKYILQCHQIQGLQRSSFTPLSTCVSGRRKVHFPRKQARSSRQWRTVIRGVEVDTLGFLYLCWPESQCASCLRLG